MTPVADELPLEVILAIQRILNVDETAQTDPLDTLANNFSPLDALNQLFPDEPSLGSIDATQARLVENEQEIWREIEELQADLQRDQSANRILLIQEMISVRPEHVITHAFSYILVKDLLGQMSLIREKATESEAVVRNITKDIQVLDLAKKNLVLTMTTLKRLQMLGMD